MSFKLGLTGSIGMGKSTTARLFQDHGCAVWDADATVHALYAPGGAAVAPIAALFPQTIVNGAISRDALKNLMAKDPTALPRVESIVHPLVQQSRAAFANQATADILVLDIPLLFETGAETQMDAVAVVFVDADTQKARVLARGTMTKDQFNTILAKQMPIKDKLARATYRIETDTIEHAKRQVAQIVSEIRTKTKNA